MLDDKLLTPLKNGHLMIGPRIKDAAKELCEQLAEIYMAKNDEKKLEIAVQIIITVPGNYGGQIIWNVTAEPKFKNESIPPITTNTPPVSEEPSGDNSSRTPNVKTGDDTNVIFSIGEKTGYEESIVERLSHPIQCLQPEGTVHNTCTVS